MMDGGTLKIVFMGFAMVVASFIETSNGHTTAVRPTGRSDWDMHNCGTRSDGVGLRQWTTSGVTCGVCGDALTLLVNKTEVVQPQPRPNEYGGKYWPNTTVDVFFEGSILNALAEVRIPHAGEMIWRICERTEYETGNQTCFAQHEVTIERASVVPNTEDTVRYISQKNATTIKDLIWWSPDGGAMHVSAHLRLPKGLICQHCTLQYTYLGNAGQMFRTCSDIEIIPNPNPAAPRQLLQNVQTKECLRQAQPFNTTLVLVDCDTIDQEQSVTTFSSSFDRLLNNAIYFEYTGQCLSVKSEATWTNAGIITDPCRKEFPESSDRMWSTVYYDAIAKTFQLKLLISGMCLTATDNGMKQTKCVQGQLNQLWKVATADTL